MDDQNKSSMWIWVIIAIVVIIGIIWYLVAQNGASVPPTTTPPTTLEPTTPTSPTTSSTSQSSAPATSASTHVSATTASSVSHSGTLSSLLSLGGNYVCTFSTSSAGGTTQGTVYVSGSRLRGDFTTTPAGGSVAIVAHMLQTSGMTYGWISGSTQGFQLQSSAPKSATPEAQLPGFDYTQSQKYSCKGWGGDASLFAPPKGITFTVI